MSILISEIPFDKVRDAAIAEVEKYMGRKCRPNSDTCYNCSWADSVMGGIWEFVDKENWDKAREIDKALGLGLFDEETMTATKANGTTYKGYESATAYHQAQIEKEKAERFKPLGDENSLFQWPGMRKNHD